MANLFYRREKSLSRVGLGKSERIPVIVDNDPNLGYEKTNWWYFLMIPFILLLAFYVALKKKILGPKLKINTFWFDGVSKKCREIKENAAQWRALDIIYNYQWGNENLFTDFWLDIRNAQAVRNRSKLIKYLLLKNIEEISKKNNEIKLISLASGSAQGVIETVKRVKEKGILVKAILIDLDPTAIEHSKKLVENLEIKNQFTFINKTASIINEIGREFKPHLIEMVGFLEYRPFDKAVKLINSIYQILESEGIFLVSQIAPNFESFFLKTVINWPMIYRKPHELIKIISLAGFPLENCSFYWEPLKIHFIIEGKKI